MSLDKGMTSHVKRNKTGNLLLISSVTVTLKREVTVTRKRMVSSTWHMTVYKWERPYYFHTCHNKNMCS